ncbi:MAG: trypsin-like peptidase domain-containing protein [Thermoguttaceae bacterium]
MKRAVLLCMLSALLGGLAAFGRHNWWPSTTQSVAQEPTPSAVQAPTSNIPQPLFDSLTPEERVNVMVYQQVNRSVVNINTRGVSGTLIPLIDVVSEGEGSGAVLDRLGHVVTNFHVVEGAKEIHVTLFDGKSYDARLSGGDPQTDVAVLKIDAPVESLYPVTFGSSSNLMVGQRVFAIGNPFGLERTLATGIISSLNRSLPGRRGRRSLKSIIQLDAAINPGNSGGPLLDTHALLIGMNTAIASKTGESAGVAFAIPVNTIARVVPQLIQNGRVRRPEAGILKTYPTDHGLMIAVLTPRGPAERAGLQGWRIKKEKKQQGPFTVEYQTVDRSAADLIVAVDGRPIKTFDDLADAIDVKQPGDVVAVTVIRNGQQVQVPLRLEASE